MRTPARILLAFALFTGASSAALATERGAETITTAHARRLVKLAIPIAGDRYDVEWTHAGLGNGKALYFRAEVPGSRAHVPYRGSVDVRVGKTVPKHTARVHFVTSRF